MLLEASKDAKEPLRAAIMLGLCYGLRRSEVCGLRWIDIDFQQKTMRIRHTVTQNGDLILDEDHTKTKRSNRTLVLLDETIPYLKELLAKQKEAGLVMDKVVAWMNGKKVQPNSITRIFHTFLRKRGMGHIRFHDLRHPYVKHTTKKYNSEKQKTQATNFNADSLGFLFLLFILRLCP